MSKERDLYLGELTEYTAACVQETYNFCFQELGRLGIVAGSLGLDIGSNLGHGLKAELANNYKVVASDYSFKYISLAKDNLDLISTSVLDARHLPFPENSFDFVMMHQVIEHLEEDEQSPVVSEIVRVIKDKGIVFISTPNADSRPTNSRPYSPDHKHEMGTDQFLNLLANYFEEVSLYGQRFIKTNLVGRLYHATRSSLLSDIYFYHLPKPLRHRLRDKLAKHQQSAVIKPVISFGNNNEVPRSLLAVCCYPKKTSPK